MSIDTYHVDASDAAAADPQSVWSNDANGFDGNTGTNAFTSTTGSSASNYLMGEGTNSPTGGNAITQVRMRFRSEATSQTTVEVYTNGLAETLGSAVASGVGTYSSYTTLTTPSGGWTWQKVNDLEAKAWRSAGGTTAAFSIIEVEVTSSGPTNMEFGAVLGLGGRVKYMSPSLRLGILQPEFKIKGLLALYEPQNTGKTLEASIEPGLGHPERLRYPSVALQGGWMNPTNVFATDSLYTSQALAPGHGIAGTWVGFGYDGVIPSDAIVTRVELVVRAKADIDDPNNILYAEIDTNLYSAVDVQVATASTTERTYVVDATQALGISGGAAAPEFYDASLVLSMTASSSGQRITWYLNSLALRVTWQVDELTKRPGKTLESLIRLKGAAPVRSYGEFTPYFSPALYPAKNLLLQDAVYATGSEIAPIGGAADNIGILLTNCGFIIPAGSTITSVLVHYVDHGTIDANLAGSSFIQATLNGTGLFGPQYTALSATDQVRDIDITGLYAWTPAILSNPTFGISYGNDVDNLDPANDHLYTCYLDEIWVEVAYTPAPLSFLTKLTMRPMAATQSFVGALLRGRFLTLAATLSFVGAQAKAIGKSLGATLTTLGGAPKEFPVVQSVAESSFDASSASHNVAMPATVKNGDMLYAALAAESLTDATPSGWNAVVRRTNGTTTGQTFVKRWADGTEGGTTVDFHTAVASVMAAQVYRISGAAGTGTASTQSTSSTPNPPASATSWGPSLWTTFAFFDTATVNSYPSGYTGGLATVDGAGPSHVTVASAWQDIDSTSENPGTYSISASNPWIAVTTGFLPSGNVLKQTNKSLAAILSFLGSVATVYTPGYIQQALSATLSFAGAISRKTGKALPATLPLVGAATKSTSRSLSATLSSAGATLKQANRTVAATLSSVGSLLRGRVMTATLSFVGAMTKRTSKSLAATATFVGALPWQLARTLSAALSFGGALTKLTSRALAATLPLAGLTTTIKAFGRQLAGTLSFVGATAKQTTHVMPATAALVGATTKAVAHGLGATLALVGATTKRTSRALAATLPLIGTTTRQVGKALTGTVSFVGAVTRGVGKALAATLPLIGAITKRAVTRTVTATLALVGATLKQANRTLAAVLALVGAVATLKAFGRTLAATLSFVGSQTRQTSKALAATAALVGATTRLVGHSLAGTLSFVGSIAKQTRRTLAATLALIGTITTSKTFVRTLVATLSFVGNQARQTGKSLSATLITVGAITSRAITHQLAATLALSGSVARQTRHALVAVLALVGSLASSHLFAKALAATLSFVGAVAKQTTRTVAGTLPSTGAVTRRVGKALSGTLAPFGAALRFLRKNLAAATLGLAGATYKQTRKIAFLASLTFTSFFDASKSTIKTIALAATLAFNGVMKRTPVKRLVGTVSFTGAVAPNWLGRIRAATEYVVTILGRVAYAATHRGADARVETIRGATAYYPAIRGVTAYRHA